MNQNQELAGHDNAFSKAAPEHNIPEIDDRYADGIMRANTHLYDAFEIQGVRDQLAGTGTAETHFEVDNENPQSFSVYAHHILDGADAVGDHGTYELAAAYAAELSTKYGRPVHDYVKGQYARHSTMQ